MTVYLLEDETNILKHILSLVQDIPYLQLVGYSDTVAKARQELPRLKPELILADIQLKDGNSFELFKDSDTDAHTIFITAYNQYAIDALNLGAFAYLLKPVDTAVFTDTVHRCFIKSEAYRFSRQQLELSASHYGGKGSLQRLALKSLSYTQIVDIEDILYCQSDKGYTTFHLKNDKPVLVCKVIKEYEALLPKDIFLRCHQSYLVNTRHISKYYKAGYIEMVNGIEIPISERKKSYVQEFIERAF
ncbi:LytR/AlgR family response regulator transcription factor [Taibaiella koreensis]|uniref:LytR/AlgR family response regulator transcription factor n=1 Tax=Taibaiella koreensis TaxID=1268548 RepID=UPI000E59B082|nr:LytTR family DNA-binding domain-containing protein [Taibaiella koreensis]